MVEARDLVSRSFSGKCNPFVMVCFERQERTTDTIMDTVEPIWTSCFTLYACLLLCKDLLTKGWKSEVYEKVSDFQILLTVYQRPPLFRNSKQAAPRLAVRLTKTQ